mgnify:CR=1 FL=1
MNKILQKLARYHNESIYQSARISIGTAKHVFKVNVQPIKILMSANYSRDPDLKPIDILDVGVSALVIPPHDILGDMEEISWEGPLDIWYNALANDVQEMTNGL